MAHFHEKITIFDINLYKEYNIIAPLFRIEAIRGCGCTGSGNYYPQGPVDAYVSNIRAMCNELLAENARLKEKSNIQK